MCQGPFNKPKLPGIPGITDFKGHTFHTARWDYEYTGGDLHGGLDKLAGKRVAIIGTGASGIGVIPHLAQVRRAPLRLPAHAVLHRRARQHADRSRSGSKTLKPGWQAERQRNFHTAAFEAFAPGQPDLVCDGWTEISRNLAAHLDATNGWAALTDPEKFLELREIEDYRAMERLRHRVDADRRGPGDRRVAEAVLPLPVQAAGLQRRVPADLQPPQRHPRRRVGHQGRRAHHRDTASSPHGVEYEVDCIIFASGFEITTDLDRRLGIKPFAGRDGLSLYDYWGNGLPHPARHHQPRLPQPVLHRVHPGRRDRGHDR